MVCGHVPCCGVLKKKRGGSVCVLGRDCGQIIIFRECDQNGRAALFHCYLDSPWDLGRAPVAGQPWGLLVVLQPVSL